jgi:hypothetical protein
MLLNRHMTLREIAALERLKSLRKAIAGEKDYKRFMALVGQLMNLLDECTV